MRTSGFQLILPEQEPSKGTIDNNYFMCKSPIFTGCFSVHFQLLFQTDLNKIVNRSQFIIRHLYITGAAVLLQSLKQQLHLQFTSLKVLMNWPNEIVISDVLISTRVPKNILFFNTLIPWSFIITKVGK